MIQIDMEMPKSCMDCRFNATGCAAMGRRFEHPLDYPGVDDPYDLLETQRMPWCPLKDVKTDEPDQDCADCELSEIEKMNGGCQLCRAR